MWHKYQVFPVNINVVITYVRIYRGWYMFRLHAIIGCRLHSFHVYGILKHIYKDISFFFAPFPAEERSKAQACGGSFAGWNVCLL
jgi:hypothetical protein